MQQHREENEQRAPDWAPLAFDESDSEPEEIKHPLDINE